MSVTPKGSTVFEIPPDTGADDLVRVINDRLRRVWRTVAGAQQAKSVPGPAGASGATGATGPPGAAGAGGGDLLATLYDPTGLSWSWANQGASTVNAASSAIFLNGQAVSGQNQLRVRYKPIPATPYIVEAVFMSGLLSTGSNQECGMLLYDTATAKAVTLNWQPGNLSSAKWNNVANNFASSYVSQSAPLPRVFVLKIADDGATRIFGWSVDGLNYIYSVTNAHNDFVTPTSIGFYVNSSVGLNACGTLISWHEH